MKRSSVLGVAAGWILLAAPALADGWKFPNLNPFKTETTEVSPYVAPRSDARPRFDNDQSDSGFKLPSLKMPGMSDEPKPPGEPSAWQKFNQGTKSFFNKTADVLTPWDNDEKPSAQMPRATGSRRVYNGSPSASNASRSAYRAEPKKKSWIPSWFSKDDDEIQQPRTVNGFIAQPRPRF